MYRCGNTGDEYTTTLHHPPVPEWFGYWPCLGYCDCRMCSQSFETVRTHKTQIVYGPWHYWDVEYILWDVLICSWHKFSHVDEWLLLDLWLCGTVLPIMDLVAFVDAIRLLRIVWIARTFCDCDLIGGPEGLRLSLKIGRHMTLPDLWL